MSVSAPSAQVPTQPLAETAFTKRLERRVLRFIQQRNIFSCGERVVLAVSGGPDSSALLVVVARMSETLDISITAAHFNHKLRTADESADDLKFATDLSASLGVQLVSDQGDTRACARHNHESMENAARRLRYTFLGRASEQVGASAVAVGHTLDDQAETILLHVLRGSGLDGLSSMRPRAPWPFGDGPTLARPLLCLRRKDTERYCRDLGIEPQRDPTNDLPIATRNRIRLDLLPALRGFNPRIEESLARLGEAATQDSALIDSIADEVWQRIVETASDCVSFPREEIESLHPALLTRIIRRAVAHLSGSAADLEAAHIDDIHAALSKRRHGASLPRGLTAVLDARSLSIMRGSPQSAQPIPDTTLPLPGRTTVGAWIIETTLVAPPRDPRAADPLEVLLDADAVGDRLTVRSRRPGDKLQPLGLRGEKKVQDILVDAKVPATERDGVPIVCTPSGIAWIAGHRIDQRYALTPASRLAVHIRCTPLIADG